MTYDDLYPHVAHFCDWVMPNSDPCDDWSQIVEMAALKAVINERKRLKQLNTEEARRRTYMLKVAINHPSPYGRLGDQSSWPTFWQIAQSFGLKVEL